MSDKVTEHIFDTEQEKKDILNRYRHLLKACKPQMQKGDRKLIRQAFEMALEAHKDMRRKSGEPYIFHPLAVSQIVTEEMGLGPTAVMCALLHDVVEDTELTLEDITREFGKPVAEIIDGLTKISAVFDVSGNIQAENVRKILLTMAKDVRVILIKIADRLHNMRTLGSMPREKQFKITSETLYLYVPLAHRLGFYNIKSELEDLCMKYNEPTIYEEIERKIRESQDERKRYINEFIKPIKDELLKGGFKFKILSRPKAISSIWRKMKSKNVPFEEVFDIFAIRIIIDTPELNEKSDCWKVYSVVTDFYHPNPDRLRDWISTPKANGYEALHTTVMGPHGRWVEVQIRSERMNELAEKGYAAHWKYKDTDASESAIDDWLKRIREMLENPDTNAYDFLDNFKLNLYTEEIYVFTPKGELKILPANSTVLDFAFEIHSDIGLHCIGAKVNQKIAPQSHNLSNGDQIEILTSKKQKPSEEWLIQVVTAKAKSVIKNYLKEERNKLIEYGKHLLERIFRVMKISFNSVNLNTLVSFYQLGNTNDLFYSIGIGNIPFKDIYKFSRTGDKIDVDCEYTPDEETVEQAIKNRLLSNASMLVFGENVNKIGYNLATCCKPIPGDDAFGFMNKNNQIEIHKANCPKAINLIAKFGYKIVKTKWTKEHKIAFLTGLKVTGVDDVGIMLKISNVISGEMKINMQSITIDSKDGVFEGIMMVYVDDTYHLQQLIDRLKGLDGILSVNRFEEVKIKLN